MRPAPLVALLSCTCFCACVDLTPPIFGDGDGGIGDAPADMAAGDAGDARDASDAPAEAGDGPTDRAAAEVPGDLAPDRMDGGADVPPDVGPDAPALPRLVGHWKLDTNVNDVAVDSSGFNHPGTVVGTPAVLSTGLPAPLATMDLGAFDLTRSTDDSVRIPDHPDLRPTGGLTVALWVRFSGNPARRTCGAPATNFQYLINKRNNRGNNGSFEAYALVRLGQADNNTFAFIAGNNNASARDTVMSTGGAVSPNAWHHVAGTFDGSFMRLYVDGILQGSARPHASQLEYDSIPAALFLGRSGECTGDVGSVTNNDAFLNGALDDVRIYEDALSGSAIADLAAGRL